MNLDLTADQELLRDTFEGLLSAESSADRVREAEENGFDGKLWSRLVEVGTFGLRVPEAAGGTGMSLFDAVLVAEQAGRHLVSGPLVESIVACGGLAAFEDEAARRALAHAIEGERVVSFAPGASDDGRVLVPGGAVARSVVGLDGDVLVLRERAESPPRSPDIGTGAFAAWNLSAERDGSRTVLAEGEAAHAAFERMRVEWRLLTAAALGGLSRRSIEIAAVYATERIQFDRPIGSFQAVAHPLAELITAIDGGAVLVWRAVDAIARGLPQAAEWSALAFGWMAEHAPRAAHRALHTHGGYGLSDEYDIQLFHRRSVAWSYAAGDPGEAYVDAADHRWRGRTAALPDAGECFLDFALGEEAERFRDEARAFFDAHPATEEQKTNQHNFDGFDPDFHRAMAEAGLLYVSWPEEYGGRGLGMLEATVMGEESERARRSIHAKAVTSMVGQVVLEFGSEALKQEVIPRILRGEVICSLGFTEPGSGSDVAAAVTRARQDGEEWIVDGQKMFTSGANIAQYVFLLTRTNPEVPKHKGLTMFLVPLDAPGVDIQAIHTLSNERTNATYYTEVRIPDRYRIGPVDGGWAVLGHALHLEHGSNGDAGSTGELHDVVEAAAEWAVRRVRNGAPVIENESFRAVLGRAQAAVEVTAALGRRQLWVGLNDRPDGGAGPMVVAFKKDAFIDVSRRLLAATAPDSVLGRGAEDAIADGAIEFGYRLAAANAIYGGTAEILKSVVAQATLGMPRSRG
ncbi:MAG: acyl-CoA dehydrogenase [bacterium]|nr:acyl-CoA dehydrogenase [bacterium]